MKNFHLKAILLSKLRYHVRFLSLLGVKKVIKNSCVTLIKITNCPKIFILCFHSGFFMVYKGKCCMVQ